MLLQWVAALKLSRVGKHPRNAICIVFSLQLTGYALPHAKLIAKGFTLPALHVQTRQGSIHPGLREMALFLS